jgi:hypothetical protein
MLKAKFRFTTYMRGEKKLKYCTINLTTSIKGITCEMQLDTGDNFTFLTNEFIKKYQLFDGKIISKEQDRSTIDGCYSHIKNVSIGVNGLGDFRFPKCYIEIIKTSKEQRKKLKEISGNNLPFAGYLGTDILVNKVFEIDYKKKLIILYASVDELISLNNRIEFYPFYIHRNTFSLPYILNNLKGNALFDTGSSRYTIILRNSTFKKLFRANLTKLCYEDIIRPDFTARIYKCHRKIDLILGSVKTYKKIPIHTPSRSYDGYLFPRVLSHDAILGNALFLDKKIVFDTIKKRYAILSSA